MRKIFDLSLIPEWPSYYTVHLQRNRVIIYLMMCVIIFYDA